MLRKSSISVSRTSCIISNVNMISIQHIYSVYSLMQVFNGFCLSFKEIDIYVCTCVVIFLLYQFLIFFNPFNLRAPLWSWSHGSWIYNYPCNQCLSTLKLWVQTSFMARCIRYIMGYSLYVTSDRSVVFSGFLHQ
jgi:hypothetical protein